MKKHNWLQCMVYKLFSKFWLIKTALVTTWNFLVPRSIFVSYIFKFLQNKNEYNHGSISIFGSLTLQVKIILVLWSILCSMLQSTCFNSFSFCHIIKLNLKKAIFRPLFNMTLFYSFSKTSQCQKQTYPITLTYVHIHYTASLHLLSCGQCSAREVFHPVVFQSS